jgi:hypothetical protein
LYSNPALCSFVRIAKPKKTSLGQGASLLGDPWARDEAVGEVVVEGPGLLDPELQHDHEAQAVDGAVVLVLVLSEVVEGLELLLEGVRWIRASFSL